MNNTNSREGRPPESPSPTSPPLTEPSPQKPEHDAQAAFWDNLSQIHLTKRALQEFDRRNTQAIRPPPAQPPHSLNPAIDYLAGCEASTVKNIKQTSRHGGPDLSDIRACPISNQSHSSSTPTSRAPRSAKSSTQTTSTMNPGDPSSKFTGASKTKTKNTGAYDRNFLQHLVDHGIYPSGYRYSDGGKPAKPNNWEEIQARLKQRRASLSPSRFKEEDFERFSQADVDAAKERHVTTNVLPILEGNISDAKCVSGGVAFANLDQLTDGSLKAGKPDTYHGARPEQLDRRVRDELGGQIIPTTQHDLPIAPNSFLAAIGPDGTNAVLERQACYHGALGARGMHSLQSYKKEPQYDNKAYTITSIYQAGQLKLYTSHPIQQPDCDSRPEYIMSQLNTWGTTGNIDTFREGAAAYRNARDWAKEQRDEAIRHANQRAAECQDTALATAASLE